MASALGTNECETGLATPQILDQQLAVQDVNHIVGGAVNDLNTLTTYLISHLSELLRRFMMPAGSKELEEEACARVCCEVLSFHDLLRYKSISVGREVTLSIGLSQPLVAEDLPLYVQQLVVERAGHATRQQAPD